MIQPVYPKIGIGKNCLLHDVYNVVPQAKRINRQHGWTGWWIISITRATQINAHSIENYAIKNLEQFFLQT